MVNINKMIVGGHLGQDPEVRYMPNGNAVCNISVATTEKWKDKNTGEQRSETEWHRVTLYSKKAELAGQYLSKGSPVMIEGKLKTRKWKHNDGSDRSTTEIIADVLHFLGSGDNAKPQQKPAQQPQQNSPEDFDDIPF